MRRSMLRVTLPLLVLLIGPLAVFQPAALAQDTSTYVSDGQLPATDGTYMAWTGPWSVDAAVATPTIWARRLSDGHQFTVGDNLRAKHWVDVDNGTAVWLQHRPDPECPNCAADIVAADLVTGETRVVAEDVSWFYHSAPAISGDYVVWFGTHRSSPRVQFTPVIYARNIRTMEPAFVVSETTDRSCYYRYPPRIEDDRVIWMECYDQVPPNPVATPGYGIWTKRLADADALLLVDSAGTPGGFDISADLAIYVDYYGGGVFFNDLTTNLLVLLDEEGENPVIDGTLACWERGIYQGEDYVDRIDLKCADAESGAIWTAIADAGPNSVPHLSNGWLVWERGDYNTDEPFEVHAVALADTLPSAPVSDPLTSDATWFAESRHTLSAGFRAFWEANGALPVFGYPLTEEFTERNPDTDTAYTVQYTERQRYEFHPELSGTPYAVLLGRLGAEDAIRRGISVTPSFQAAPRPADTFPCTWHEETRHGVCGAFRDYWSAHGLDLGDDGTSYRESLALFGYPLSEQFFDESSGFTTQYFERAVFEWHPDNAEEYRVLLRRLGAELLVTRGWRVE